MKKIISIMLAFILIFSAISVSVTAADLCTNGKEHEWSALTVVPASCTEKEYQTKECERCHQVYKKYTSGSEALGHIWTDATCTEAKHCTRTECDATEGVALGHMGGIATCVAQAICTRCSQSYGTKANHTYATTYILDREPTCTTAGSKSKHCTTTGCTAKTDVTAIPATGHKFNKTKDDGKCTVADCNAVCSHTGSLVAIPEVKATCTIGGSKGGYECNVCGKVVVDPAPTPALGHDIEVIEGVAPTCITTGKSDGQICKRAGCDYKVAQVTLVALGHSWGTTKVVIKEATCTSKGSKAIVCTREGCNAIKEGTAEEIALKAHDWDVYKVVIKEPTCETEGEKGVLCKACKTIKAGSTERVPRLGHDWDKGTVKVAADCQKKGTTTFKCKRTGCGKTEDRRIEQLECDYKETIKEPTCTEEGYSTFTCSMCKSSYIDKKVDKLNHNIDSWYEKAPTCTEDGITRYGCLDCDYTYTEPALAFGHDYPSNWSIILEPDCQSKGASIKVCLRCNDVISQTLPKTGHVDLDGDSKCDTCDKTIAVVEPEKPSEPEKEPEAKPCECNCHAGGIKAFFFNLVNFFAKIFDKNARVCACGKAH